MTRTDACDVAIVGAGMVGAALALALARDGFDVTLLDARAPAAWQAHEPVDLRVVALAPSALRLLQDVGVWDAIRAARASAYRRMQVFDALAPGTLHFDAADTGHAVLGFIVENRLVQSQLWQAAQAEARITLRCPARVAASESGDARRTLQLDDGSRLSARLVVAADGADSALRTLAGIRARERDYAQRAIVAHVATERAHQHTAWQRFLPGATLAFLPLADGRSSIVWAVADAEAARLLALDDAAFCAELGAAFDLRLGRVTASTPRAAFPLRMRLAERYAAPRLVLVGDAAHAVHPLAGQGVNLGLRDVDELRETLQSTRLRGADFGATAVLRRFERRRRSDNVLSARTFDAIQRVFGSSALPLAGLRGAALTLVDACRPLKRAFARHAAGNVDVA